MNENEVVRDDDVSLFDMWKKLKDGGRYILGGAVVGTLCAGVAVVFLPTRYEAVAVVQVGVVGQIGQLGQVINVPVEPVTQAVERMKTPGFQLKVAEATGDRTWVEDLMRSSSAASKYISPQIVKTTTSGGVPLIELRTNGGTPELARKIADASIKELVSREGELVMPTIEKMRQELAIARERLASAEREFESINKLARGVGVKDDRFTQLSLMTSLRLQRESEVFSQRQMIFALETALSAPYTQQAMALENIFVADNPVSPKKALLLVLGLVSGLLVGVMAVFFVDAWRPSRQERAAHAVS